MLLNMTLFNYKTVRPFYTDVEYKRLSRNRFNCPDKYMVLAVDGHAIPCKLMVYVNALGVRHILLNNLGGEAVHSSTVYLKYLNKVRELLGDKADVIRVEIPNTSERSNGDYFRSLTLKSTFKHDGLGHLETIEPTSKLAKQLARHHKYTKTCAWYAVWIENNLCGFVYSDRANIFRFYNYKNWVFTKRHKDTLTVKLKTMLKLELAQSKA